MAWTLVILIYTNTRLENTAITNPNLCERGVSDDAMRTGDNENETRQRMGKKKGGAAHKAG